MNARYLLKPAAWIAFCAAAVAGCAGVQVNDALESARAEVNAAGSDPDVLARAPLELREAQGALDAAINAHRDRADREQVNHYAYLAQVRAQTARELARSRRATDDLARAQTDVDRLRLAARTQEAQAYREQAYQQAQAALAAKADAANASQQAAIAAQQAQAATEQANRATQQARDEKARADMAAAQADQARLEARGLILELQAKETERGLLVTLGDVLFATGEAVLLPNAAARMDKLAAFLNRFPEKTLLIEGYTDSVGSDTSNQNLSERRAEAVRLALEARGVSATRMTTRGYGESFPVASNGSLEGRSMNRRVEVVVSDDSGTLRPRLSSLR